MPTFPREVRQVLAELELISHGKCQSFNASGKPAEGHARPFGEARPEFIVFRERFEREGYSERLLEEARTVLGKLRRQAVKPAGEKPEALERRIVEGDGSIIVEGAAPDEVARWAHVTVSFVMKARKRAGRDQLTGLPQAGLTFEQMVQQGMDARHIAKVTGMPEMSVKRQVQRRLRARELASEGLSQRHIAERMGVSKSEVNRLLSVRPVAA